ncbi:MAG: hypothetical protein A2X08_15770 [Bacteroidetes bacterium GWA2_32_17]|nr:MAG: hypothetical protein A2X08_15770 [Bacteroidetes bacterium GWA2_32_17]
MKNIILIALITFGINATAQITLEQTYDSASNYSLTSELMIVNFEVSGERYVRINMAGKTIDIYDLNHSLIKSISYAGFPPNNNGIAHIMYFSENLFNIDSKMEFMYVNFYGNPSIVNTRIYNEDGTLIFQADSMAPLVTVYIPQQQFPIYNTTQGAKMILSNQFGGKAKVYSLPGTLSTAIEQANGQLMQPNGTFGILYPNPSNGAVTLEYELPKGEQDGELILYNMQGAEVKRYKVDNTFKDILLDNTALPAGTYFYSLQTKKGAVGTKKMVVVK